MLLPKKNLVAAGSVVMKLVAPFTVVVVNPAKYICTVEEYFKETQNIILEQSLYLGA